MKLLFPNSSGAFLLNIYIFIEYISIISFQISLSPLPLAWIIEILVMVGKVFCMCMMLMVQRRFQNFLLGKDEAGLLYLPGRLPVSSIGRRNQGGWRTGPGSDGISKEAGKGRADVVCQSGNERERELPGQCAWNESGIS